MKEEVSSPEQTHDEVDYLTFEVPMGQVNRNVHHWVANLMIITIFLHMIRVFISNTSPSQKNVLFCDGEVFALDRELLMGARIMIVLNRF